MHLKRFFSNFIKNSGRDPYIYKTGPKNDINNYRPISLLSPFAKLFETHLYNNLIIFLTKNNVLYNNQFGFRSNSSTDLAVIDSINDIISSIENNLTNCSIFLDLSKAFNTVNHNILIKKLEKYGIRGLPLNLIKSYLNNRQQFTTINSYKSKNLEINVGVPQGSCLGPLFFLVYVNDMHLSCNLKIRLFADDACVSLSHKDPIILEKQINEELNKLNHWLQENKLFLNYSKSNYLIFSKRRNKTTMSISINNQILSQQSTAKYLGVTIDENLTWKPHLQNLKSTLAKSCYCLSKLRQYVNKKTLLQVYYSLFYSKLQYCITSWGGSPACNTDPIFKLQKRAVRYISHKPARTTTNPLFIESKMLKFKEIYRLEICKLTHKLTKFNLNGELQLTNLSQQHNHNTRLNTDNNYYSNTCRTNLGKTSFNNLAPKFWRDVPHEFKHLSPTGFKKKYKNYLINLYNESSDL